MPSRSQLKRWRALARRKGRDAEGLALAEGPRLLRELLDSGLRLRQVLSTDEEAADPETAPLLDRARSAGVPIETVSEGLLVELADTVRPQGVLTVFEVPRYDWSDLPDGDLLVFDGVQDPGNLGTLLRTAEALGVGGAVALEGTVDPWNPKAVRASAGSVFRMPVVRAGRPEAVRELGSEDRPLWAADAGGEPLPRGGPLPERVALVLGNEGAGVSRELLEAAERRVAIPLADEVESLNVAVAAALLMDRIFSSRKPSP